MPWEIPTDAFDADNLEGFESVAPGTYHVEVTAVEEDAVSKSGSPQMVVDYEVLAGTVGGQEGKTHKDYYSRSEKALKRALMFAIATGLTSQEELKAAQQAGKSPVIDFTKAVGRQLVVEIEEETDQNGKARPKVAWGIWATNSPKAKGVPLNQGRLAELAEGKPSEKADESSPFGSVDDVF